MMMQQYRANSYLFGGNAPLRGRVVRGLPRQPRLACPTPGAPTSTTLQHVPASRRQRSDRDVAHAPVVESRSPSAPRPTPFAHESVSEADLAVARKQVHVQSLIAAYRFLGSRWADLDPLKRTERPKIPELEPAFYDLTESDMDITFSAGQHVLHEGREHDAARDRAGAARNLLRLDRRRVHAHHRPGRKALVAAAAGNRRDSQHARPSRSAREGTHPRPPDCG